MNDRAFSNIAVVVWNNFIQVLVLEWVLISIDCFRIFKNVRKYRNQVCLTENMFYMKLETETKTWGKTFLSVNYLLQYHQSILFRVFSHRSTFTDEYGRPGRWMRPFSARAFLVVLDKNIDILWRISKSVQFWNLQFWPKAASISNPFLLIFC